MGSMVFIRHMEIIHIFIDVKKKKENKRIKIERIERHRF